MLTESQWIVHACFAVDCLSTNKVAVQYTDDQQASLAVDGDVSTHSCTLDSHVFPWWSVDLGQEYIIESVTITLPNVTGDTCNYQRSCFITVAMHAAKGAHILITEIFRHVVSIWVKCSAVHSSVLNFSPTGGGMGVRNQKTQNFTKILPNYGM